MEFHDQECDANELVSLDTSGMVVLNSGGPLMHLIRIENDMALVKFESGAEFQKQWLPVATLSTLSPLCRAKGIVQLPDGSYINPDCVARIGLECNERYPAGRELFIEMRSGDRIILSCNYVKTNFRALKHEIASLLFGADATPYGNSRDVQ